MKTEHGAYVNAQETPTVFMKNSGWCWYQDPRAIVHKNTLVMGGVEGNGAGAAAIGAYDLENGKILGRTVVNPKFDNDDHNSPVLYGRPDGSLLTVYARHHRDNLHRYRISQADDYLKWGEEKTFKHDYPNADNVTYMNLYHLSKEKKLYNFFRGIAFNPCFMVSTDHGDTWSTPTHFIKSEVQGRHRPYARYVGDGKETIHVVFTDAHPRDFGNSLYYAAFRGGNFYRADGSLIKNLEKGGPLRPSEAEKIFQGDGTQGRGHSQSALNSAWTVSIELDREGRPHLAYTLYLSNKDHRYRIAFWDGTKWIDREVAYAGKCLYDQESSYTGLIALDPLDPTRVIISTDVDPASGADSGGTHEIYQATVTSADDVKTVRWEPITKETPQDTRNIRPMILNGDDCRIILWQRGRFDTYTNYELDTVGFIEGKPEMSKSW